MFIYYVHGLVPTAIFMHVQCARNRDHVAMGIKRYPQQ